MAIEVPRLNRDRKFENDKIKILFSKGSVSDTLSVYLKDLKGEAHHVLWQIENDRCRQSFDKANEKIRDFTYAKVKEWLNEEAAEREQREKAIQLREAKEASDLQTLLDLF